MIEIKRKWRIVTFDIETTGLNADYSHMICCVIKEYNGSSFTYRIDNPKYGDKFNDKKLVEDVVNKLNQYDVIVSWNGTMFDKTYINTRLLINRSKVLLTPKYNRDLIFPARFKFRLASRRLKYVGQVVLGKTNKTFTTPFVWGALVRGEEWAIDFMVEHCRKDVLDTERLYKRFLPFLSENLKRK